MHPSQTPSNGIPASLGTHWTPVVSTPQWWSKAKAATFLHTLKCHLLALPPAAQRLNHSQNPRPDPGFKANHLMLCSLGFGFTLGFFQANQDNEITARLPIACSLLRRS